MRLAQPFILTIVLLATTQASHAQSAYDYPWCAQYTSRGGSGALSCYYATYAQCMATVSGIGGYCIRSPYYGQGPGQARPGRRVYREY